MIARNDDSGANGFYTSKNLLSFLQKNEKEITKEGGTL